MSTTSRFRIMRKGSYYNILGPDGRVFAKYRSASVAGPRWEELTHTPWPHRSTAYESGKRLWELGLIERNQVGRMRIEFKPPQADPAPPRAASTPRPVIIVPPPTMLALPAPRLDLAEHERRMRALRQKPGLLFQPRYQQALRDEVAYNRPQARWARHLLGLLARYELRQRLGRRAPTSAHITARHIAWQAARQGSLEMRATV